MPRGVPSVRWMVEGDIDDPRKGKTLSAYADLRGGEGAFRAYPSTSAFASTTVGTDFLPAGLKVGGVREEAWPQLPAGHPPTRFS